MRRSLSAVHRRVMMLTTRLEQNEALCDEDLLAILDDGRRRNARGEASKLTEEECKARGDRLRAMARELYGKSPAWP
jgi:hypothetical protein